MKICLNCNQWFDGEGKPLSAGRISVFVHGSDVPKDIFTLDSDGIYTQAENPFILDDAGRAPTIWFDASTVDVLVEAYNGVTGSYDQVDTYQDGFDVPDVRNDTLVYGIDGLRSANPALGSVTVEGFDSAHDCGPRTFIWDPMATEEEDGCAIVSSGSVAEGRWVLLSDSRYMPSDWYGIVPGVDEGNVGAFLTYPVTVGQWGIRLPPVPRFMRGTYTSAGWLTSTKTLAFDTDAKFTSASFNCYAAEVMYNRDYVADFQFMKQLTAESSWFRTAKQFWKCQARELHQSRYNYFESNDIGSYGTTCAVLQNQHISGRPLTLSGQAHLQIDRCDVDDYALSTLWNLVFTNCDFTDRWFADSSWDFGTDISHRQRVRNSDNRIRLDHFADANVFVLQQAANGVTSIDLQGREVSTVTADFPFVSISNAVIAYAHFDDDIVLDHCRIGSLYLESDDLHAVTRDCSMRLAAMSAASWNDTGSNVVLGCDIDTTNTSVSFLETGISMGGHRIGRTQDDLFAQKPVVFWRSTLVNGQVASSAATFLYCSLENCPVYVYPCSVFENGQQTWAMSMEFRGNRFAGSSRIAMGAHTGYSDHIGEVYECRVDSLAITDNVFSTSSMGVSCPFWSGPSLAFRFIRGMTAYDGVNAYERDREYFPTAYEYRGNYGNCPRQHAPATNSGLPGTRAKADGWSSTGATEIIFENGQSAHYVFVLPAMDNPSKSPLPAPVISGGAYEVSPLSVCTPYRMKAIFSATTNGGGCCDFPTGGYLPVCAYDRSLPNDMFYVIIGANGTAVQLYGINPLACGE